jgi:hypothetical protein
MILHSLLDTKYLLAEDMGAEPESRYVRAACPSVLDCLSCGGFSGSLWAGSGLLSLSWLVALSALSLTSHSLWPGLAASCFLFVVLFLLLFVSPSICVSLSPLLSAFSLPLFAVFLSGFLLSFAALFCSLRFSSVLLLFSFRYDFLLSFYYFRFAMIFFCLSLRSPIFFLRSSIFLFLRSSIFFPCDLLFSFSCDLLFSFSWFPCGLLPSFGVHASWDERQRICSCRLCTRQVALDRFSLAPPSPTDLLLDKLVAFARTGHFLWRSSPPLCRNR